jgi:rod shape-determining protein MreC
MRYLYLSIIILILNLVGFTGFIRVPVTFVLTPFQISLRNMAIEAKDSLKFFTNVNSLRKENIALLDENTRLKSTIVELLHVKEENSVLREQLSVPSPVDKKLIIGNVLGNSNDLTGSTFILDLGLRDGVKIGDNVVWAGYLLGIVKEVEDDRSIVNLTTSSEVSIAVRDIDVPGKTEGVAQGQFGSSVDVKRILPTEEIKVGDTIVTSGKDGLYYPGLIVGKVKEIHEIPTETLKSATLHSIVDLGKIRKAFVLSI